MAFKTFHKGGFITKIEISDIFTSIGENVSDKDMQRLLKAAGANTQGKINYKQFSTMMKGILEAQDRE